MDINIGESIKLDLEQNKRIWGRKRIEVAFYISMIVGVIHFIFEIATQGLLSNCKYKIIYLGIYGSFIVLNVRIKKNPSQILFLSYMRGELINLLLMYFSFISESEHAQIWVQLSPFIALFYQTYIFSDLKSIIFFSIKHTFQWTFFGLYFEKIIIVNIAHFCIAVATSAMFIFACTYFDYLQNVDLCYSKKNSEIAVLKLDALVEAITDSIFVIDQNLNSVFMNNASRKLLQNTKLCKFLQGLKYHIKYEKNNSNHGIVEDIKKSFEKDIGSQLTFGVTEKNKNYLEWSGKLVIWERKVRLILFGKQVSKLVELEKEIRENQYKSSLLRTVSHELRTPTHAVLVMAQLIKDSKETSRENYERTELMVSSCTYLLCLINDLLDYSQIMAGLLKISLAHFDLKHLLEECLKLIQIQLLGSSIALTINYLSEIPNVLVTDPYRLKQVVLNLLGNARKFTICGSITLEVLYTKNRLTISCKDTGIGIESSKIDNIFSEFFKASDSCLNPQGVGLGLYISNMLTYELGGNGIKVASEPGKGSCFSFDIEASEPSLNNTSFEVPDENPKINLPNKKKYKCNYDQEILVVDDTHFNILTYMQILKKYGYKVRFVNRGRDAIDLIKNNEFLCILMDCEMPGLDGWQTTSALKELEKNGTIKKLPPIIGCTAHSSESIKFKCIQSGMTDLIPKPCSQETVIQKIKDLTVTCT